MKREPVDRRTFLRTAGTAGAGAAILGTAGSANAAESDRTTLLQPAQRRAAPYVHQGIPDVVVVGAGAFGGWSSFYLRRMGYDVLMVDKYGPGNSKATSGGETRGVRTSYGNRRTPRIWISWAQESIRRWKLFDQEFSDRMTEPVFYTTGDVILREEDEPFLQNTRGIWDEFGIEYDLTDGPEIERRWPQIRAPEVQFALVEKEAGVVRARKSMQMVARAFQDEGGRLQIAEVKIGGAESGAITDLVTSAGERVRGGRYVFALGPWMPLFFPEILGEVIRIPMGHVFYFGTPAGDHRFTFPNVPSYNVPGVTGWPALPPDYRGFRVRTGGSQHEDPDLSPRTVPEDRFERPREVLQKYFPELAEQPVVETRTCHYESSSTRNFIIDRHPDYSNGWFAGGGSAEAFKFAPMNGEFVANRVMEHEEDPEYADVFRLDDGGDAGESPDAES